jgi:hypothetical protein
LIGQILDCEIINDLQCVLFDRGLIQRRVNPTDGVAIPRMKDRILKISLRLEVLSVGLPHHEDVNQLNAVPKRTLTAENERTGSLRIDAEAVI